MKPFRLSLAQAICRFLPPIVVHIVRNRIYPIKNAYQDDYVLTVHSQTGGLFKGRTSEMHAYIFGVNGLYDWRNVAIASSLCGKGDTIIEIGANVGTETIGFADIVGASGKVFAFEPFPPNLFHLKEIAELNQYKQLTILPYAVASEEKYASFAVPPSRNTGIGYLSQPTQHESYELIEVKCITLDSMADSIGEVKFISIDVEGAEVDVLRGSQNIIRTHKPAILIEAEAQHLERAGFSLGDLINEINGLGYQALQITRLSLGPVRPDGINRRNWLCLHSSKLHDLKAAKRTLLRCGFIPCIAGMNPLQLQEAM